MVKLTVDLIQMAQQRTNPVRERELVLRGYKIPVLENLGATLDQFDSLDLSDNEIRRLDGLPLLRRLRTLMLSNNRVVRLGSQLHEHVPQLETLILTNNCLQELCDLQPLSELTRLDTVCLTGNPVVTRPHYRLFLIHTVPSVRVLDCRRVKLLERQQAAKMFGDGAGKKSSAKIKSRQVKTFVVGGGDVTETARATTVTSQQTRLIKEAIARASSLHEIERLNQLLRAGVQLPADQHQLQQLLTTSADSADQPDNEQEEPASTLVAPAVDDAEMTAVDA